MCYKADIVVGGTMCEPKWHILKLVSVFLLGGCFHSRGVTNVHNYEVWWVRLLFSSEYINLHQGKSKKTPLEGTTTWNATWVWLKHSDTLMDKKNYINTANTASCVYSDKLGRIISFLFMWFDKQAINSCDRCYTLGALLSTLSNIWQKMNQRYQ